MINTKNIPTKLLRPNTSRLFDLKKCIEEGGIATDTEGRKYRILTTDAIRKDGRSVLALRSNPGKDQKQEVSTYFSKDGRGDAAAMQALRMYHPRLFGERNEPLWLPKPPAIEGYKLSRVEEVRVSPKILGTPGVYRIWHGDTHGWGYGNCFDQKVTYIARYHKVKVPPAPKFEGYELLGVGSSSEMEEKFGEIATHVALLGIRAPGVWNCSLSSRPRFKHDGTYAVYRKTQRVVSEAELKHSHRLVEKMRDHSETDLSQDLSAMFKEFCELHPRD